MISPTGYTVYEATAHPHTRIPTVKEYHATRIRCNSTGAVVSTTVCVRNRQIVLREANYRWMYASLTDLQKWWTNYVARQQGQAKANLAVTTEALADPAAALHKVITRIPYEPVILNNPTPQGA